MCRGQKVLRPPKRKQKESKENEWIKTLRHYSSKSSQCISTKRRRKDTILKLISTWTTLKQTVHKVQHMVITSNPNETKQGKQKLDFPDLNPL